MLVRTTPRRHAIAVISKFHPNIEVSVVQCLIDFTEGFDIKGSYLLRTLSHNSPISLPDLAAIHTAFALQEWSEVPYLLQPPGRAT